jgi:hypothetical protein
MMKNEPNALSFLDVRPAPKLYSLSLSSVKVATGVQNSVAAATAASSFRKDG